MGSARFVIRLNSTQLSHKLQKSGRIVHGARVIEPKLVPGQCHSLVAALRSVLPAYLQNNVNTILLQQFVLCLH
jgi:hypothetical protein